MRPLDLERLPQIVAGVAELLNQEPATIDWCRAKAALAGPFELVVAGKDRTPAEIVGLQGICFLHLRPLTHHNERVALMCMVMLTRENGMVWRDDPESADDQSWIVQLFALGDVSERRFLREVEKWID